MNQRGGPDISQISSSVLKNYSYLWCQVKLLVYQYMQRKQQKEVNSTVVIVGTRVHKLSRTLDATSKFNAPDRWLEAREVQ